MLTCDYPQVLISFATANSSQVFVPFGALIDFEDYDAQPLKVTLVHPCSRRPLTLQEILPQVVQLPTGHQFRGRLMRLRRDSSQPTGLAADQFLAGYDFDPNALPFLCIAGVRAYHEHPAHTGDSWWLYRGTGRGTLHQIVQMLWTYGSKNIVQPLLQSQIFHVGFVLQPEIEEPLQT